MMVKETLPVKITPAKLLFSQRLIERAQTRPELLEEATKAVNLVARLAEPSFALETLPVSRSKQGVVTVGKRELKLGPYAHLLDLATEAVVYVTTLGGKLDRKINALSRNGDWESAYWLDCAGVLTLNALDDKVRAIVEEIARDRNFGVGHSLSPGSLKGWNLDEQKRLCSLLNLEQIGVSLNNASLLVPYKSASSLIGIGPGYRADKISPACDYCISDGKCWMKHARQFDG